MCRILGAKYVARQQLSLATCIQPNFVYLLILSTAPIVQWHHVNCEDVLRARIDPHRRSGPRFVRKIT